MATTSRRTPPPLETATSRSMEERPHQAQAAQGSHAAHPLNMEEMAETQRRRQAELRQQTPIWHPQHRRCGTCDDCLKGYPCLAATLGVTEQPGAFAVAAADSLPQRRRRPSAGTTTVVSPRAVRPSLSLQQSTDTQQSRRSSVSHLLERQQPHTVLPQLRVRESTQSFSTNSSEFMAVAVRAVIVDEENDPSARELELRRQAAELEQQEAQLRAWQEELEQQRLSLQQQQQQQQQQQRPSDSLQNSFVSTNSSVVVTAVPEETFEEGEVGSGPMRFAPQKNMRSCPAFLMNLDTQMLEKVQQLEQKWASRKSHPGMILTPQWHTRFLWFYAQQRSRDGSYKFPMDKIWKAEKKLKPRFVNLNVGTLAPQLYSKTLFPVPGLKTKGGHDMFYMRPSRYFPSSTPTNTIIDNLCYVMNTMCENSQFAQKEGIGFVACMDSWSMTNFDVNYCYQFMMALQGFMVPVKTQLFLIVNPPTWFGAIWKIMKPMLAPSFRKRVKICPEFKIAKYLAPGYEEFLPNDMRTGKANTDKMVVDFIAYRQFVEQGQVEHTLNLSRHNTNNRSNNTLGLDRYSTSSGGDEVSVSHSYDLSSNPDLTGSCSTGMMNSSLSSDVDLTNSEIDDGEDGASIHCDIHDEDALEGELDASGKSPSSMAAVHFSNLPSL